MCQEFYWTARLFAEGRVLSSQYFETRQQRDSFVRDHPGWVKRGKICKENLEKHLQQPDRRTYAP